MNFKRIEIIGFKSFADRISIEFDAGITAIVGPNGCGKSNFADAIRWVLGEQSPKLLRGSSMQDVIFKGAEGRKGLSYCEVALVFDNTNRMFNIDYDEVVISRKLFRSGDREYALNRAPCLLKDINNLLHDSGIGRDGYSIIGQGKVEEIVSSKPENRRVIFEEAAGIAKFKERKVEAERKLERTRDNITRLQDIVTEIERQLNPMKKQAETAKLFLEFRDELKTLEVNNYIYHYENANENKRVISERIEGLRQQVEEKTVQVSEAVDKHNKSLESIKAIDAQIQGLRDEILELTVGLEKQAGDYRLAQAKLDYMREQSEKLQQELEEDKAEFEKINIELGSKQTEKQENIEKMNALQVQIDEMQKVYIGIVEKLNQSEAVVSNSQKQLKDEINKISDIKANISRLQTEISALKEHENDLTIREQVLSGKLDNARTVETQAKSELELAEAARKNIWDELSALRENLQAVEKNTAQLQGSLSVSLDSLAKLETRSKLLNEMQTEYEGYNGTVRKLLVDAGKNAELKKRIVGVVAELITVPQKLETAIEMALGAAVQNIITNNENDAKELVKYLKNKSYGRATFLPITSMKPRFINDAHKKLLGAAGCFGVACDIIEFDKKLEPVFKGLLGGTVIVDNMDTAVKLANESRFGFKIVTLEGDIINPAGSITGGSKKTEINNLLSREREIATIGDRVKSLKDEVAALQNDIATHKSTGKDLSSSIEANVTKLHDRDVELAQKQEIYKHAVEDFAEFETELGSIREELTRTRTRKTLLNSDLEAARTQDETSDISGGESVGGDMYDTLRGQRDALGEQLTQLKIQSATIESKIQNIDTEIARLLTEQNRLNESIDETTSLLVKNTRTMETAMQLNADKAGDAATEGERVKLDEANGKVAELEELKERLHASLSAIEEERTRLGNELAKAQEKLFHEEAKLTQIDTNIENMQQRILDDYELTYLTALDMKVENYDAAKGQTRINELKREISKLGYVNVNAIEESKVLDERYQELSTQMEDLLKAEDDVLNVIKELSSQMTERFETEFQKINTNFSRTFRELFGGGNARLVLTDDDVLTAGVDIIAEPPGKSLGNLSLLSGGEKSLTAIAILFAILKLRPMPFCLLDEIDAALDDANVERFAKYLHRFAQDTQFIVITHRKPTMELADSLYGVTMENKGVSKVVSVKLSDAQAMVQSG